LNKIVIFGVGLIGGSFALALRKANAVHEVVGFGRSAASLEQAKQLASSTVSETMQHMKWLTQIWYCWLHRCTDAGVICTHRTASGAHTLVTDGAAPRVMWWRQRARIWATRLRSLFGSPHCRSREEWRSTHWLICIKAKNGADATVRKLKRSSGACAGLGVVRRVVSELTSQQHDEVFAAVSHLPHLLSFALVHDLAQRDNRDQLLSLPQRLS